MEMEFTEVDLKYLLDILDSLKKDNDVHDGEDDCECKCCAHVDEEDECASDLALELPAINLHIGSINFTFNFWNKDCDE